MGQGSHNKNPGQQGSLPAPERPAKTFQVALIIGPLAIEAHG